MFVSAGKIIKNGRFSFCALVLAVVALCSDIQASGHEVPGSAHGGARLVVPNEGFALGEIVPGESIQGEIVLTNCSESPFIISRIKACCGGDVEISSMAIPARGDATLTLHLKMQIPGEISKSVILYCDDAMTPVVTIPVTGRVLETSDVQMVSGGTLAAVVLAGLVDGFNPCSFAVMISLAGILAIGGRKRRARVLGGLFFCLGSFVTYMLMGLGLMQALRALEGLKAVHDVVMVLLAVTLFVLAFLSFRDALRFRRIPVFSVVTLKLPENVKILIRKIALRSWSGPAVVVAGLGCGFLVTLLDSLCTGQVYVPILALISREPGAWRAFALLVVYNLAFILPLVAVFVLASKTTDAFQMARWSSVNVIPAKVGLGIVFLVLAIMLLCM